MKTFIQLRTINVNDRVEKKEGLPYLSWAWAWAPEGCGVLGPELQEGSCQAAQQQ